MDPVELGTTLCEAASTGGLQKIRIFADNGADINQGQETFGCKEQHKVPFASALISECFAM